MANLSGPAAQPHIVDAAGASLVQLDWSAVLFLMTGVMVCGLGLAFTVREGGSKSIMPFLFTTAAGALWLVFEGVARGTLGSSASATAFRLALVCAACVPAAFLWFTHTVTGGRKSTGISLIVALATACALSVLLLWPGTDIALNGTLSFGPDAELLGTAFTAHFAIVMLVSGIAYATQLRRHRLSDYRHRRARLLIIASAIGALCSIGFLPALGIAFYADSSLAVAVFFLLVAYVMGRFRISDITPALVGAQIAQVMPDALLVLDRDTIVRQLNPAALELLGVEADALIGQPARRVLGRGHVRSPINTLIDGNPVDDFEVTIDLPDGQTRTVSISATAVREFDQSPRAFVFILHDISTRKAAEERIRELAFYDTLTELPNRAGFFNEISRRIERDRIQSGAVLFLDLDRFKLINDTLGHDAGDKMLAVVARRLQHCLRQDSSSREDGDTIVARFGGDEFVVALCNVDDIEQVVTVCQRVLQALAQPIDLGGQEVFSGASIGVSRYPCDGDNLQTLLKCADLALYEAKADGRNAYQIYDETLAKRSTERARLEADIRNALERDEFRVHYQPIVDYRTGRMVGAEALLRWQHPRRGAVPPDVFVPVAEEIGAMSQLGEQVLREACTALKSWNERGFDHMSIAVNLSDHQFRRRDLADNIQGVLREYDLVPDRLILEVTEAIIMNDPDFTRDTIRALKSAGTRIGVDDFGTGYSSFNDLKQLGVDMIKVDGRFTQTMADQDSDGSVARAIIRMAQSLNLQVIAEGVENTEQAERLDQVQCHFMQGFLHGAPMSATDFVAHLDHERGAGSPDPTLSLPAVSFGGYQ
ncbi:MAG: EAL domain-containing protein [Pseudomonadota bacterium]